MWTAIVLAVVALPADNSARPHSLLAANAGTDGKSDGFSGECKDATCASAALHFMPYFAKEGKADASAIAAASTGCACTFGDGPVPDDKHQPKSVTTSSDAPLCMYSEDASEMLIKEEEVNLRVLDCHGVQGNLAAEKEKAITCLTPDYADALKPKRAAFLLGDSHGEDFELPLRMALRGQFQLLPYFALGVGLVPGHDANPARLTQSAEAHDWCARPLPKSTKRAMRAHDSPTRRCAPPEWCTVERRDERLSLERVQVGALPACVRDHRRQPASGRPGGDHGGQPRHPVAR